MFELRKRRNGWTLTNAYVIYGYFVNIILSNQNQILEIFGNRILKRGRERWEFNYGWKYSCIYNPLYDRSNSIGDARFWQLTEAILKEPRSQCRISSLGAEIDGFLQLRAPNEAFDSGHFWKCFSIFENFTVARREMKGFVFPLRYCAIHQTQNKFVRARGTHCDIISYHKRRSWPSSPPALSSVHFAECNPAGNDISGIRSNAKRHFHGGDSILNTAHWDSIDALEEENIIWHPIYCFVTNEEETSSEEK